MFVIIGLAIFVLAAVAVAQIHRARSVDSRRRGQPVRAPAVALPAGFSWYSQRAGAAGSGSAGFRVALPTGWRLTRTGNRTFIAEPAGSRFLELDLTPHVYAGMIAELRWLQHQSLMQGKLPGYHRYLIRPVRYQGTVAADWEFSWRSQSGGQINALDRVLIARGPAGGQSFAIYWSTPASQWRVSRPLLSEIFATFSPVS